MAGKLAILTAGLALAVPSAARAETTYCVDAPGCAGNAQQTLQAALNAADVAAGADRIEVGPGEYPGPFAGDADNTVAIVGAGRGKTVLTAGNAATVLVLSAPDASVSGVTARFGAGTGITAPRAQDVAIEGTASPATGFVGFAFISGTVDLGAGTDTIGISVPGAATASQVEGARVRAQIGITVPGELVAHDVAIELTGGAAATGVLVGPPQTTGSATLRHVTIAGAGDGTGLAVRGGPALTTAGTAFLRDSIITGVARHIVTSGAECTDPPPACVPTTVTTSYSAYDPAKTESTGADGVSVTPGTPAPVGGALKLDGSLRPRHDSPLIDTADPAGAGATDASGAPRVVDGDGDGGARSDVGALEYQRRAPVITGAGAVPGDGQVGVPIAFGVQATDPDGEGLTAAWAFSGGTTATGFDVSRAFATPGQVVANVTVTDEAGVTAGASVTATVRLRLFRPRRPPSRSRE